MPVPKPVEKKVEAAADQSEDKKEEDSGPAPVGNGGTTSKYTWTQTLTETHMYIPVASDLKSSLVKVHLALQHLTITIKGEKFIDNDFPEKINVDDSLWTLETEGTQKFIHVFIQKWTAQMHWWDCALQGDEKIDTKKINPENSKLSDLDGETRTTVISNPILMIYRSKK